MSRAIALRGLPAGSGRRGDPAEQALEALAAWDATRRYVNRLKSHGYPVRQRLLFSRLVRFLVLALVRAPVQQKLLSWRRRPMQRAAGRL